MSDARRERRARLASNDEREGGGFTLPSFIMAAVETIMDTGTEGAEMASVVAAVETAASSDRSRVHHIWKGKTREASMGLMVDDLVQELIDADYVRWTPESRLVMVSDWQGAGEDGGWWVRLDLRPHGAHRALVFDREQRDTRAEDARVEFNWVTMLNYIAKPRIGSKESEERIAHLERSMRATGYDRTKPLIRDPDGRTLAGHHREAAAARAGITPVTVTVSGLEETVRAVWRDNDGRRWSDGERGKFAEALAAEGKTYQQIADALNVSRQTVGNDLAAKNGQPKKRGRPSMVEDPAIREAVARGREQGLSTKEIAELAHISTHSVNRVTAALDLASTVQKANPGILHPTPQIDPPQTGTDPAPEPPLESAKPTEPEFVTCSCCDGTGRRPKTAPA